MNILKEKLQELHEKAKSLGLSAELSLPEIVVVGAYTCGMAWVRGTPAVTVLPNFAYNAGLYCAARVLGNSLVSAKQGFPEKEPRRSPRLAARNAD